MGAGNHFDLRCKLTYLNEYMKLKCKIDALIISEIILKDYLSVIPA